MAYRLALPPQLANVHNVFHISMLRKYLFNADHIINHEDLEIREDLTYEEKPIKLLDRKIQRLRNRTIPMVKVQWSRDGVTNAT